MGLVGSYQIDYARLLSRFSRGLGRSQQARAGMVLEQLGIADVASGGNFHGQGQPNDERLPSRQDGCAGW
jgi:hypothetical protein